MLRADAARGRAQSLRADAARLTEETSRRAHALATVDASGPAVTAGRQRAAAIDRTPALVAARLDQAAGVLDVASELLAPIEAVLRRLAYLIDVASEQVPLLDALQRQVYGFGEAIDWLCARRIDALCTDVPAPVPQRLSDFGTLPASAIHELNLSRAPTPVRTLLESHPDATLLEVGPDTMVVAIGDVDTAPAAITVVPGVGSGDVATWGKQLGRAEVIARATRFPTIMWLGYRAPDTLAAGTAHDPARRAALRLRDFQGALRERRPRQRRIVLGYSYGSTVVGNAGDMASDATVFLGSPGVGDTVRAASDVGTNVYALTAPGDPIGITANSRGGVHGVDPTSPAFGAAPWPASGQVAGGHGDYFVDPVFLTGLRRIAAGERVPVG